MFGDKLIIPTNSATQINNAVSESPGPSHSSIATILEIDFPLCLHRHKQLLYDFLRKERFLKSGLAESLYLFSLRIGSNV